MKADRVVAGWRPFSTPTLVAGLFAAGTAPDVHGASLTGDELEIYFSCARQGEASFHIWKSTRITKDAVWNTATMVNEITGSGDDRDPDVSANGLTLYFASNRFGAGSRFYVSQRTARGNPWEPISELSELSSPAVDRFGPSVDQSGLFMVLGSASLDSNDYRLYSASRSDPLGTWGSVQDLSDINSGKEDNDPALFNGLRSLVWSSRAPSNGASWDLVEVSRPDLAAPFSAALMIPLDTLNTSVSERYPWVSQDGTHIVFSREPGGEDGVLYEAWR